MTDKRDLTSAIFELSVQQNPNLVHGTRWRKKKQTGQWRSPGELSYSTPAVRRHGLLPSLLFTVWL
jgi:hypothetical protein